MRLQTGAEKQLEDITLGSLEAKMMSNMVKNWNPKSQNAVVLYIQLHNNSRSMLQHLETRTTEMKSAMK